jgi:hypothetical protein
MKYSIILFVLFCLVSIFLKIGICFSESNSVDVSKKNLSITLQSPQKNEHKYQFLSTEPIHISVSINNKEGLLSWLILDQGDEFSGFKVKMLRKNEIVSLLPSQQNQKNIFRTSSMTGYDFNKSNIFTCVIKTLNKRYDMSLDGEYFVSVEGCAYDINKNSIILESNELRIVIDNSCSDNVTFSNSEKVQKISELGAMIVLTTNQNFYKVPSPIYLRIYTKNISKNNLSMIENTNNVLDTYNLILKIPGFNRDFRKPKRKEDVQDAKLTLYGQKLVSEKSKNSKPVITVKPGEEVAETVIMLNRIFDMSEEGIYGLIVSRKFIDKNGKEQTVTSDPLPIRVGTALTQDEIDQRIKERQEKEKNTKK